MHYYIVEIDDDNNRLYTYTFNVNIKTSFSNIFNSYVDDVIDAKPNRIDATIKLSFTRKLFNDEYLVLSDIVQKSFNDPCPDITEMAQELMKVFIEELY